MSGGKVISIVARRKAQATAVALEGLRRIDGKCMVRLAEDFERQAAPHPEVKTRLVTRLAALFRALAAEQEGT